MSPKKKDCDKSSERMLILRNVIEVSVLRFSAMPSVRKSCEKTWAIGLTELFYEF